MTPKEKVISVALAEEGYLEKKTNYNLDSKTENAGKANYTKYSRDLLKLIGSPYAQGVAWCDIFVDWCFVTAFGVDVAKRLINGWSAYTPTSADNYKKVKRWYNSPEVGDQIFFKNSSRICHTGLVYKVDATRVYTVEGNTSNAASVVANGGCVALKSYLLNTSSIAGYGRPDYSIIQSDQSKVVTTKAFVDGTDITEALNPKNFNVEKYRNKFKDLENAFGDDWALYYKHYVTCGKIEIEAGKRQTFM